MINLNFNTPEEIWKDIPDFLGYQVSTQGRVRSFWRTGGGNSRLKTIPQKILRSSPGRGGYLQVGLSKNWERYCFAVHRLVLFAFIGPCPLGMQACHYDGKRINNYLGNLRWDTPSNNYADTRKHGASKGIRHHNAKLSNEKIRQIRELASPGFRHGKIAKMFGVSRANISLIISRKAWGHIP